MRARFCDPLAYVAVASVVRDDERTVQAEAFLQSLGEFRARDDLRLHGDDHDVLLTGLPQVLDHAGARHAHDLGDLTLVEAVVMVEPGGPDQRVAPEARRRWHGVGGPTPGQ